MGRGRDRVWFSADTAAPRSEQACSLLDTVIDYLPSPLDIPDVQGLKMDSDEPCSPGTDDAPFNALAFKVMNG